MERDRSLDGAHLGSAVVSLSQFAQETSRGPDRIGGPVFPVTGEAREKEMDCGSVLIGGTGGD